MTESVKFLHINAVGTLANDCSKNAPSGSGGSITVYFSRYQKVMYRPAHISSRPKEMLTVK